MQNTSQCSSVRQLVEFIVFQSCKQASNFCPYGEVVDNLTTLPTDLGTLESHGLTVKISKVKLEF